MAFKPWNPGHLAKFNSSVSSEFLDAYDSYVDAQIQAKSAEPAHQTFSGSSFRCNRKSWFRLRGVQPDIAKTDTALNFSADIGTACHRIIQTNLSQLLGDDWIPVNEYIDQLVGENRFPYDYSIKDSEDSLEYLITIFDPPLKFACDGLIRWNNKLYLLEIKTSEFSSWNEMTDPKSQHIDQVKCYSTILDLDNVLFLYQDRQYGGLKCYELHITDSDKADVLQRFQYVQDMVEKNLAPEALPKGDPWCTPAMCQYYNKCTEYGR